MEQRLGLIGVYGWGFLYMVSDHVQGFKFKFNDLSSTGFLNLTLITRNSLSCHGLRLRVWLEFMGEMFVRLSSSVHYISISSCFSIHTG